MSKDRKAPGKAKRDNPTVPKAKRSRAPTGRSSQSVANEHDIDVRARELELALRTEREKLSESIALTQELYKKIDNLERRIANTQKRLEASIAYAQGLLQTRSWRVTRPIRFVTHRLRQGHSLARKFASTTRTHGVATAVARAIRFVEAASRRRVAALEKSTELKQRSPAEASPAGLVLQVKTASSDFPTVAMMVHDFDQGGLETVVLDLAEGMLHHNVACPILVAGYAGRAARTASEMGCIVRTFNGDTRALTLAAQELGTEVIFSHHCYQGIEQLSDAGVSIVEVLHNAYHWHKDDISIGQLRASHVQRFVGVSEFVSRFAIERLNVGADRLETIENGLSAHGLIRPPLGRLTRLRMSTLESPLLVHVANFNSQKNHFALLHAFKLVHEKHPSASLAFAGDMNPSGATGKQFEREISRLGLEHSIRLAGSLRRRELSKLLCRSHIGLLPSAIEGFSIASLEYSFFGLPCVLSDTGAAESLATRYGHTAIVPGVGADPNTIDPVEIERQWLHPSRECIAAIADQIEHVLSDYERYALAGREAGLRWHEYSVDKTVESYLNLAKRLA